MCCFTENKLTTFRLKNKITLQYSYMLYLYANKFLRMRHKLIVCSVLVFSFFISLGQQNNAKAIKETKIKMVTTAGTMVLKLYDDTPIHKKNFIDLVNKHFYDSLLFHRVINHFMIQGGDPDSKYAPAGVMLGEGEAGRTVPAEIMPEKHFHKKGVLAAARNSDDVNPNKESSSCQFYIVHGKVFDAEGIKNAEERINSRRKADIMNQFLNNPNNLKFKIQMEQYKRGYMTDSILLLQKKLEPILKMEEERLQTYKINDEQRNVYMKLGGTPHLDSNYTVFGEVIEGLDIIDVIAGVKTNENDRPIVDVRILKMTVLDN